MRTLRWSPVAESLSSRDRTEPGDAACRTRRGILMRSRLHHLLDPRPLFYGRDHEYSPSLCWAGSAIG
jgi:hypothetical protein